VPHRRSAVVLVAGNGDGRFVYDAANLLGYDGEELLRLHSLRDEGGNAAQPGPLARSMARPPGGGSGIRTILVPLPHTQHPVTVFFAKVGDAGPGGFEDPQAQQAKHGHQREVAKVR
jgi:hypothetical protein